MRTENATSLNQIDDQFLDAETLEKAFDIAPPQDKGRMYSIFYEVALESLKENGKIKNYEATVQYSDDDISGIDYWLITTNDKHVPISITGTRFCAQQRRRHHPEIPTIAIRKKSVKETKTINSLKKETIAGIEFYLRSNHKPRS